MRKKQIYVNLTCENKECGKQFLVTECVANEGRKYCTQSCCYKGRGFKIKNNSNKK
jgi:hypothetical protein